MDWVVALDEGELYYIPFDLKKKLMSGGGAKGFMDCVDNSDEEKAEEKLPEKADNNNNGAFEPGCAVGLVLDRDYHCEALGFLEGNPVGSSQVTGDIQAEPMLTSNPAFEENAGEQQAKGFMDFFPSDSTFILPADNKEKEDPKEPLQKVRAKSVLSKLQRKKKKDGHLGSAEETFLSSPQLDLIRGNSNPSTASHFTGLKTTEAGRGWGLHASDSFQTAGASEAGSPPSSATLRFDTEPVLLPSRSFATQSSPINFGASNPPSTPRTPRSSPALRRPLPPSEERGPSHKSPPPIIFDPRTPPPTIISSPPVVSLSSPPQSPPLSDQNRYTSQRRKSLFSKVTSSKEKDQSESGPHRLSPEHDTTKRTKSGSFKSPVLLFRSNQAQGTGDATFLSLPKSLTNLSLLPSPKSQRGSVENKKITGGLALQEPITFFSHLVERVHQTLPVERHDGLVDTMVGVSGQADDIFVECLNEEFKDSTELSVVIRQASPAVLVLKSIGRPILKPITELASPLIRFGRRLDDKAIELMGSDRRTKHSTRLKEKLDHNLGLLLSPRAVPLELCALSYRSVECLKKNHQRLCDSVEIPLASWAVGAMLFLRYLVPMLTTFLPPGEQNKKGCVLMGRFLMKMACHSEFQQNPGGLLNEVLVDSYDRYDQFCAEVARLGGEHYSNSSVFGPSHSPFITTIDTESLAKLGDFLKETSTTGASSTCEKEYERTDEWKEGVSFLSKRIQELIEEFGVGRIVFPDPLELNEEN